MAQVPHPLGQALRHPQPVSPGRFYLTSMHTCDCPDFTRRGKVCKHILAVRLHVALVRSQHPQAQQLTA